MQVEKGGNQPVVKLEEAFKTKFDFWLRISTLVANHPVYLPVTLAERHKKLLAGKLLNGGVTLSCRSDGWWLSLSVSESLPEVKPTSKMVGLDVGIANFLTDSDGQHFGTVGQGFMVQVEQVKEKTARKARLRDCLKQNGVSDEKLPSTSSVQSQRLSRRIKHDIKTAVVQCFDAHPDTLFVIENMSVSAMRFKSRQMNRYLKASQIGHIQQHLYWTAAKRGVPVVSVLAAYSSQGWK